MSRTPREPGPLTTADRIVTVLLFAVVGFIAVALVQVGAIVAFPADVCGGDGVTCTYGVISAAAMLASYGPLLLLIAAVIVAVHRILRLRIAFVVPVVCFIAIVGLVLLAGSMVDAAIARG